MMKTNHVSKGTHHLYIVMMAIMMMLLYAGYGTPVRAASVTSNSGYYVTTRVSKKKLKKGKKAKVTVMVTNSSGKVMNNLKINVKLPAALKKTKGKLQKTKATLAVNQSFSFSFYVKAKKKVNFHKTVTAKKIEAPATTKVTSKNLIKVGKAKKYMQITFTCKKPKIDTPPVEPPSDYAVAVVNLLSTMYSYARSKNGGFAMISNGGYNLYGPGAATQQSMLAAVDGVLIEDAFTDGDRKAMQAALKEGVAAGKKAFSIEYKSFTGDSQIVSYKAPSKGLNTIPSYTKSNVYNVSSLSDVKDFMAILDPKKYKTKKAYFDAINNTDYDLVFIDLFYGFDDSGVQIPLTAAEVNSLKKKKNGGSRKICAYLSVGEAEDYRYYWDAAWDKKENRPAWIAEENEEWDGNYKVRYWEPAWQNILYGSSDAYLDMIIGAGFDGVYLDVIDAYEYFEHNK